MKWILSRDKFLNEAKLKDVLNKPQIKRLKEVWGEKYLNYEEVEATDRIKQGRWKLSDEDRDMVINSFFKTDYAWVREKLASLPDKFAEVLTMSLSIDYNSFNREQIDRLKSGFEGKEFNIKKLQISQISCLNYSIFKSLNAGETKGNSIVVKDESGRPLRDENNNIIKKEKEPGEPSFSSNIVNLNTFITSYNNSYPEQKVDASIFLNSNIQNITNMIADNPDIIDFDLFGEHEMYLMIEHNAVNIMNMSISKFYKSCQELYFGGGHGTQYMIGLLMNVFDPNTVPAFLVFNTPYYNITERGGKPEKLSDVLPLCRLLIRSIEPFNETSKTNLYFDKTYPERMSDVLHEMIQKYSDNRRSDEYTRYYPLAPDIQIDDFDNLGDPYMDNLSIRKGTRIGKNTKKLYLSNNIDWSNVIIDKSADIQELIIETPNIPSNFFNIKMSPKWVKFKYIKILNFIVFKNLTTDRIGFYQCELPGNFLNELYEVSPGIKSLSLGSVDNFNADELKLFKNLEELEIIYSLSYKDDLEKLLEGLNLKKLAISGDLLKDQKNKIYIESLRKSGVLVDIKGLVI